MKPYEYDGRGHEPPYPAPEIPPDLSQELADAMEETERLRSLNVDLLAACKAARAFLQSLVAFEFYEDEQAAVLATVEDAIAKTERHVS